MISAVRPAERSPETPYGGFTPTALALAGLGLLIRMAGPFWATVGGDGGAYSELASSLVRGKGLTALWGDAVLTPTLQPLPSHHWPPLWPMVLAAFKLAGVPVPWASVAVGLLGAVAVAAMAWDLYGKGWGLLSGTAFMVLPRLVTSSATAYSENLVVVLFCAVLWALKRSLKDRRWVVAAGLFAGLGYLSRSTLGFMFVVAAGCGLAWRLRHRGARGTFGDPWYGVGALVFGSMVLAWVWRNVRLFGLRGWSTSTYNDLLVNYALVHPLSLAFIFFVKLPFFAMFVLGYAWLIPWKRGVRSEGSELMGLSILLSVGLGLFMASTYWVGEGFPIFWPDNERYAIIAAIPILWLAAEMGLALPSAKRVAAWGTIALILSAASVNDLSRFCDGVAVQGAVRAGEHYAYVGNGTALYSTWDQAPPGAWACRLKDQACRDSHPTVILDMDSRGPPPGFTWRGNFSVARLLGSPQTCQVYQAVS